MNSKLSPTDLIEEIDLDAPRVPRFKKKKRSEHAILDEAIQHGGVDAAADEQAFRPTFTSSRHEREWILTYLGEFYDEQMITDVIARVKGGKEATVYCCTAFPGLGADLLAAKIYRPRQFRSLRNDTLYREGRGVIDESGKPVKNDRELHAVQKGSSFGKTLSHISWLGHEFQTLERLYAAGASVPRPYSSRNNTILMEYLGEAFNPAPTLNEVRLGSGMEARRLFDALIQNVEIMLANQRIHGDLSAYNVLYWEEEFRLIDFPQAIDPNDNRSALPILTRDLVRLCEYFVRYDIRCNAPNLARSLWKKHGYGGFWVPDETDWEDTGTAG